LAKGQKRYAQIIERIFKQRYKENARAIPFERKDLVRAAKELKIEPPDNLGDLVYSFRYRADLPEYILTTAPEGMQWIIRPVGKSRYEFSLSSTPRIAPNMLLAETKIPDATPGLIAKYALNDEQALLAKLRYNRLIDIFSGVTCYSLQNHLRTTVMGIGQIEVDELYVGVDQRGVQYVFPVQAKGGLDRIGIVQIEQDVAMCAEKFPQLACRPIAAQFIDENLIALYAFEKGKKDAAVAMLMESHYRLVSPEDMTEEDLKRYRSRKLATLA